MATSDDITEDDFLPFDPESPEIKSVHEAVKRELVENPYVKPDNKPGAFNPQGNGGGKPKPLPADPNHWTERSGAPRVFNHRHQFMIHLAALGCSSAEIARRMDITRTRMSVITSNPRFQAEVTRTRKEMFAQDPEQMLKVAVPKAIQVINDVLDDQTERGATRISAAFQLLDRTHGKPVQRIEHEGTLLKDLFRSLESMNAIDISAQDEKSRTTDEIDSWIDKNLPN